tara:strand:- start:1698 stop:2291 length:594 start_codon:yes stop_codon:yes gene_type:complete
MKFKGKEYTEVKDRLIAFSEEYPQATIHTELLAHAPISDSATGEYCNEYIVKAIVTPNPLQEPEIFYTGHAAERDNTGFVNKTSALENCETSAVGRALAIAGFGGEFSIASKEEVENAKLKQKEIKPTIKSLEEIDTLAKQCKENGSLNEEGWLKYTKQRSAGYFDTKARVEMTKNAFITLHGRVEKESTDKEKESK